MTDETGLIDVTDDDRPLSEAVQDRWLSSDMFEGELNLQIERVRMDECDARVLYLSFVERPEWLRVYRTDRLTLIGAFGDRIGNLRGKRITLIKVFGWRGTQWIKITIPDQTAAAPQQPQEGPQPTRPKPRAGKRPRSTDEINDK